MRLLLAGLLLLATAAPASALDTVNKRRSVSAVGGVAALTLPPVPDGALVAADRYHVAGFYAGFSAGANPVPTWFWSRAEDACHDEADRAG